MQFVTKLVQNIRDCFFDTDIFSQSNISDPKCLPKTPDEAMETNYGRTQVQKLADHYGAGDTPIIDPEQLMMEWSEHRVYTILNCLHMTPTTFQVWEHFVNSLPNLSTQEQVCLMYMYITMQSIQLTVNGLSRQCVESTAAYKATGLPVTAILVVDPFCSK